MPSFSFELFFIFIFCSYNVIFVQCNQNNTSTRSHATSMTNVLSMEDELILNLQRHKLKLKDKLELIKFYTSNLQREHKKSKDDPEQYLSNPLNAFKLIRRMYADWSKWQDFIKQPAMNKEEIEFIKTIEYRMPTSSDLEKATAEIVGIQNTYEMDTKEIASGILRGKQFAARFNSSDCYTVGKYLFNQSKFEPALNWFNASLELYSDHDSFLSDVLDVSIGNIWYFISKTYLRLGDLFLSRELYEKAVESTNIALKFDPNNEELRTMEEILRLHLSLNKLCRGDVPQKSNLHCRYNTSTTPFLKLAPFKTEEIALDPYIVIYHDVIYENEIEELKRVSIPQLQRGFVGQGVVEPGRTVQRADLFVEDTILIDRFDERTHDITGLDFSNGLTWQVVNYGIGGHYDNHVDYYNFTLHADFLGRGNRIAAIIYYMSDVEIGGGTAFAEINTVVQPKKGSAILWYHLDNTGEGNYKALHASCPVLMGSKWMFIKLAYYWPQMFRVPCHKT